jgi:hypothetical protein
MSVDRDQLIEATSQVTSAGRADDSALCWRELASELNCIRAAWARHGSSDSHGLVILRQPMTYQKSLMNQLLTPKKAPV